MPGRGTGASRVTLASGSGSPSAGVRSPEARTSRTAAAVGEADGMAAADLPGDGKSAPGGMKVARRMRAAAYPLPVEHRRLISKAQFATLWTWSINSVCHVFGRPRFHVEDHSTNVLSPSPPSASPGTTPATRSRAGQHTG